MSGVQKLKTVILCGGLGTRLSEETTLKPKPMVEIGEFPILWHIMKIYEKHGFDDFVLALGYRGDFIKDYFMHYYPRRSDITVRLKSGEIEFANTRAEDWTVRMVNTGENTMTGGRLKRLAGALANENTFFMTYGDGVSDVDIQRLLEFHRSHGKIATLTAVRPPARFGTMEIADDRVTEFKEKPQTGEGWINGGFFVFNQAVFDYLEGDTTILEKEPLENLSRDGQLMVFRHHGFWKCMDTVRDRNVLEELWRGGQAPWKIQI